jgi:hypothetical protein
MNLFKITKNVTLSKHDNKADDNDDPIPPPPEASMGGVQLNFCFGGGGRGGGCKEGLGASCGHRNLIQAYLAESHGKVRGEGRGRGGGGSSSKWGRGCPPPSSGRAPASNRGF